MKNQIKAISIPAALYLFLAAGVEAHMQIQETKHSHTHIREYSDGDYFFIVEYTVPSSGFITIPATNPLGQPHHSATIQVWQVIGGQKLPTGEPFQGQWTPDGCFEDDPKMLVEMARERAVESD